MDTLLRSLVVAGIAVLLGCENQQTHQELVEATPYEPVLDAGPMPQGTAAVDPTLGYYSPPPAPAPAPVQYEPPPVSYTANTYVVQKGDTLWSIAKRTYNDGRRWQDIQAANPGISPTRLRVGQEIMLP